MYPHAFTVGTSHLHCRYFLSVCKVHVLCAGHRNRGVLPRKGAPHLLWLVNVHTLTLVAWLRQLFNYRHFFIFTPSTKSITNTITSTYSSSTFSTMQQSSLEDIFLTTNWEEAYSQIPYKWTTSSNDARTEIVCRQTKYPNHCNTQHEKNKSHQQVIQ